MAHGYASSLQVDVQSDVVAHCYIHAAAVQGSGTQVDHKRELLRNEQVAFDNDCTISKAAVASLEELQQLLSKECVKAETPKSS